MKECYIIGYKPCQNKETKEDLLRIIVEIKSKDEKLVGNNVIVCFLEDKEELRDFLNQAIEEEMASDEDMKKLEERLNR